MAEPVKQIKLDGLTVDSWHLNFSGSVTLNPENENDAKLISDLLGGREIAIPVKAYVSKSAGNFPRDKEGALKSVDKSISLKVAEVEPAEYIVLSSPTR